MWPYLWPPWTSSCQIWCVRDLVLRSTEILMKMLKWKKENFMASHLLYCEEKNSFSHQYAQACKVCLREKAIGKSCQGISTNHRPVCDMLVQHISCLSETRNSAALYSQQVLIQQKMYTQSDFFLKHTTKILIGSTQTLCRSDYQVHALQCP